MVMMIMMKYEDDVDDDVGTYVSYSYRGRVPGQNCGRLLEIPYSRTYVRTYARAYRMLTGAPSRGRMGERLLGIPYARK